MLDTVMLLLHIRSTITTPLISQSVLSHFVIANGWLALSLVSAVPRHTRKIHGLGTVALHRSVSRCKAGVSTTSFAVTHISYTIVPSREQHSPK
ncbi:hypothetical protein V8C40DRAFT_203621 [Trichoderma camerunense]